VPVVSLAVHRSLSACAEMTLTCIERCKADALDLGEGHKHRVDGAGGEAKKPDVCHEHPEGELLALPRPVEGVVDVVARRGVQNDLALAPIVDEDQRPGDREVVGRGGSGHGGSRGVGLGLGTQQRQSYTSVETIGAGRDRRK
jgi:hypothetical protein